jgi:type IV fimbrial biogenesis protein FimT
MKHRRRPLQCGATVTELTVGLGIAAGAAALAVPSVQDYLHAAKLVSVSNELLADLHLARSEALMRNRRVALCKSADGVQCAGQGGWQQGWIVFQDENNNGEVDPGEETIAAHAALEGSMRLSGNQPVAKYISFTALGATKLTGGSFQAGTLTLCRASAVPTPSRQVILNSVGRPRVQRATVPACA